MSSVVWIRKKGSSLMTITQSKQLSSKTTDNQLQEETARSPKIKCRHLRMDLCRHDMDPENHYGYHQIQMAEGDEDKTNFFTEKGVLCYRKMPFGLKNARATYQRLIDKLRAINMKLKPKKYSFGFEEGPFLGHLITKQGIKANPLKVKAISDLKLPRTLKEIQSLNEKLAALSRFLSKGADKSLPFFKLLKSCMSKKTVQWKTDAEEAFQKIKKKTSSNLLHKQGVTRGRNKLPRTGEAHTSPRIHCKKDSKDQYKLKASFKKYSKASAECMQGHDQCEQVGLAGDLGLINNVLIPSRKTYRRQVKMDESNLTVEEYIELEVEKARRRGQTFNWETAMYGKVRYHENIKYFRDFERDFPAIIYKDALTSDHEVSSEPTVRPLDNNEIDLRILLGESDDEDYICIYEKSLFSYKLISVNDFKTDSKKDIDEVNLPRNIFGIEQLDNDIDYNVDTQSYEFNEDFETNHDAHGETFNMEDYLIIKDGVYTKKIAEAKIWHYHPKIRGDEAGIADSPRMVYTRAEGQDLFTSHAWRSVFEIQGPLVREFMLELFLAPMGLVTRCRSWTLLEMVLRLIG
ncbi:hypothetical protein Tco_0689427 [Tanacetum coccineum]